MVDTTSTRFIRWIAIVVAVVIVAFGGLSLVTVQLARQAQFWVSHTQTVIAEAKTLLASMVDAETGERGYLVNDDENYLQSYRDALTNLPLHFERLKELSVDNPAQLVRLAQMESLIKAKLEIIARVLDAHRHGAAPPIDKAVMDKFRLAEAAFEQEENRLFVDLSARLDGRYRLLQGLSLAFALLSGVAAVFGFRKYRHVAARALATLAEEQLRLSIESAPAAIAMFDRNMCYIAASRRFAEDYRIDWNGLVGRSHYDVFPEIPTKWREIHRRCLEGAVERCAEDPFLRVDGSTDWLSWEIRPWRDPSGALNGVVLWSENITQRKQSEEALRKTGQRLRRFYDSGLLGLAYWNMNGQIVDANDKFLEMVGYERSDLASGRINWQQMTPAEFAHLDERSAAELQATGVNPAPFEKEYIRKDGSRLPVLIAGAMLDEARFDGVVFVIDITERKQAELALAVAKSEAERANLAKSKFLAAASHDLCQPVQSLTLLLSALERQVADRPKAAKLVDMANASMACWLAF